MKFSQWMILIALALCGLTVSVLAAGGSIAGTVTDPKGALIADAAVAVTDPLSNQSFTAATDKQGRYKIEGLPAGGYVVTVTAKGFADFRKENVNVQDDNTTTVDVRLDIAAIESTVTTTGTKTKANTDPIYQELRKKSESSDSLSGNVATVNNLALRRDAATFMLKSGELYFLAPIEGRVTGAVFFGEGEMTLTPPIDVEKKSLAIFTNAPTLTEQFTQLVLRFTDSTFEDVKNSPQATMQTTGGEAGHARDAFRDVEALLRKRLRANFELRTLSDLYTAKREGFFTAFISGKRYNKLVFVLDPLGVNEVAPEEETLLSYGTTDFGYWTAFHRSDEYAKGLATTKQDHRLIDITRHEIDGTIKGTRIAATDTISFVALSSRRVIPFNLYRSLRVSSVKDQKGEELDFIQESKDEDADFAVILKQSMKPGNIYSIIVQYEGGDALRDLGGGNYFLIPRDTWYPNNPQVQFGDRAAFEITMRYPKGNVFVGTGSANGAETEDNGMKVSKWTSGGTELMVAGFNYGKLKKGEIDDKEAGYNMEVYGNTQLAPDVKAREDAVKMAEFATGENIETLTGGDIRSGSGSTLSGSGKVLAEARNSVRIYNSYFGKLPYTRIAMTQQPAGFFGQAWPTLIYMPYTAFLDQTQRMNLFVNSQAAADRFWQYVAPHEVAHQWWGHVIGWTSYRDQWMSEGFAEFSASLYVQRTLGVDKFVDFWEQHRKEIVEATPATKGIKPYTIGPVTQGVRLSNAKTSSAYRYLVYPKGAYIVHMLRMLMYDSRDKTGDPDARFKAMMQDFVKTYFNQDVSTEDFKHVVEKHMTQEMDLDGNQRMDWFFNEWVYGTDVPAYKFEYTVGSSSGKTVLTGKITQEGVSDNFKMRVPLWVDSGKGWVRLGAATLIGNSSLELPPIPLAQPPKRAAIAALNDVLTTSIQTTKR